MLYIAVYILVEAYEVVERIADVELRRVNSR